MDYNVTYRKKDKSLQCIISYKDENGKWKQKSKQGFKAQKDAKPWIDETTKLLEEKMNLRLNNEYNGITYKEYRKLYVKDVAQYQEYASEQHYMHSLEKFSKLDDILLRDISFIHIQDCVNDMIKEGLSVTTIKNYIGNIKTAFNEAAKQYKIIPNSPIDDNLKYPKPKTNDKAKALNKIELDELLSKLYPHRDYYIALIAATCGLRLGEIIGLTLPNIDLDNAKLHVTQQWKQTSKGVYGLGKLKSKNSYRTVPIPPKTITALKEYLSTAVIDTNKRIFLDRTTGVASGRLLKKIRRFGFDNTVHDLRHTYASFLTFNGIDVKTGSKLMGHTVQMFIKTYSHFNDDMMTAATVKINTMF